MFRKREVLSYDFIAREITRSSRARRSINRDDKNMNVYRALLREESLYESTKIPLAGDIQEIGDTILLVRR